MATPVKIKLPAKLQPTPAAAPQPVAVAPQPVVAAPRPVVVAPKPAAAVTAPKPVVVKPKPVVTEPAPEPVPAQAPEVTDDVALASDYSQAELPDLKAEYVSRGLGDGEGMDKVAIIKALIRSDLAAAAPAPEEPAPEKPTKPEKVAGRLDDAALVQIMEILGKGEQLLITRTTANKWAIEKGSAATVVSGPKLSGDAYWREVLTPEYYAFYYIDVAGTAEVPFNVDGNPIQGGGKGWSSFTKDEKFAFAQLNGIEWEVKENDLLNTMTMGEAVQSRLGILKYKEQYRKPSARDALKR